MKVHGPVLLVVDQPATIGALCRLWLLDYYSGNDWALGQLPPARNGPPGWGEGLQDVKNRR
jgi:hypothetical protein